MAGITRYGSYLPYNRLQRSALGGGKGERTVASYDEDSVSMAVEAGRDALRGGERRRHADLRDDEPAVRREAERGDDRRGARPRSEPARARARRSSTRMGLGALVAGADAAAAGGRALVVAADVVIGAPGGAARERRRRRRRGVRHRPRLGGHRALHRPRLGDHRDPRRLAPADRSASRSSGRSASAPRRSARSRPTRRPARSRAPGSARPTCAPSSSTAPTRARSRSCPRRCGLKPEQIADPLAAAVGRDGRAHVGLVLARTLDRANAGDRILVVSVADGCDAARARGDRADRERAAAALGRPLARREAQRPRPTTPTSSGAASCPSSRRAGPSPSARPRRRCGAPTTGSTASSARAARAAAPATCRRSACA